MPLSPRLKAQGLPAHLQGLHQYWFETAGGLDVECWLGYEAGESVQALHPGATPTACLLHAFVNTADVTEILSDIVRDMIEFRFIAFMEETAADAKALRKE